MCVNVHVQVHCAGCRRITPVVVLLVVVVDWLLVFEQVPVAVAETVRVVVALLEVGDLGLELRQLRLQPLFFLVLFTASAGRL
jgi:hypothetical protein